MLNKSSRVSQSWARLPEAQLEGRDVCVYEYQNKSADHCTPSAWRESVFSPYLVIKIKKKCSAVPDSMPGVIIGY